MLRPPYTLLGINAAPQQFPPRNVTPRQAPQSNEAAKFIVMIVNHPPSVAGAALFWSPKAFNFKVTFKITSK